MGVNGTPLGDRAPTWLFMAWAPEEGGPVHVLATRHVESARLDELQIDGANGIRAHLDVWLAGGELVEAETLVPALRNAVAGMVGDTLDDLRAAEARARLRALPPAEQECESCGPEGDPACFVECVCECHDRDGYPPAEQEENDADPRLVGYHEFRPPDVGQADGCLYPGCGEGIMHYLHQGAAECTHCRPGDRCWVHR